EGAASRSLHGALPTHGTLGRRRWFHSAVRHPEGVPPYIRSENASLVAVSCDLPGEVGARVSHAVAAPDPELPARATPTSGAPGPVLYSTAPHYTGGDPEAYARHVAAVARWSEAAGCEGILVYTDNSLLDPWLCSQIVIKNTRALVPLVAVQPIYLHPYAVAK